MYMPILPKLYVNHPAHVIEIAIVDNRDGRITNITPHLCHRNINVSPMQLNRADAEQILDAYTPYASVVTNSITIPTVIVTMFAISANFKNALSILLLTLSVIFIASFSTK